MSEKVYKGSCYCGAVRWEGTGKPLLSGYCHCTLCQRLAAAPFIHTIHFSADAFKWTHEEPVYGHLDLYAVEAKPWKKRWRCKSCGACAASFHEKRNRWSVWGAHFERDEEGRVKEWEDLKPSFHMFYGTRAFEVNDNLPKWSGYTGESERLD